MCFDLNGQTKAKIARKDITVYKAIDEKGWGWLYELKINGKTEKWKKGYWYTETHFPKKTESRYIEKNAFHSLILKSSAKCYQFDNCKLVEMVIPKGAYYYKNKTEYCSSDIIYVKDL